MPAHAQQDGAPPPGHDARPSEARPYSAHGDDGGLLRDGAALPPVARVVISEIMANPKAVLDSQGEWFELHNIDAQPVDLAGWTIRDDPSSTHVIKGPVTLKAGGYLVLGRTKDPLSNGGVKVHYVYGGGFYLANASDQINLHDGAMRLVDRVRYDAAGGWTIPEGASLSRGDLKAPAGPAGWCKETAPWSGSAGDRGTPGTPAACKP